MLPAQVVDCSVVVKWVLPEPGSAAALRLLDEYQAGLADLIAPDILLVECASLLSKRVRRRQLSARQADEALRWLTEISPELVPTVPMLADALRLSTQCALSLWDCTYLTLGIDRDCSIVTADQRLFRGGKARHPRFRLLG